jgi:hypothetical protein
MPIEHVTIPLTGAGDSTAQVATDSTPSGVVQLFKLAVSADGSEILVPAGADGLYVAIIERAEDPQDQLLIATSLAAGSVIDKDAVDIATGKTGRLLAADIGASVPIRVDLQCVNGARITRTSIYALKGTQRWKSPTNVHIEQVGGAAKHFGCEITNLHTIATADARVTLYWDEVTL